MDDFSNIDLRVGLVTEAVRKEGSEKLIKLTVDFGDSGTRTIFTALYPLYNPDELINNQYIFIINLTPRKMMDEVSEGMIMAADDPSSTRPALLIPSEKTTPGAAVR